jgi:hypothetical protein
MLEQLARQQGHVVCGRDVRPLAARGRQAVHRVELGVVHVEVTRLGVHQLDEGGRTSGHMLGQRGGGIVGRVDGQGHQQVADGELLAVLQVHLRAAHLGGVARHGHDVIEGQDAGLDALEHHQLGHHLEHRGRRTALVLAVGLQDHPRVHIEDDGRGEIARDPGRGQALGGGHRGRRRP